MWGAGLWLQFSNSVAHVISDDPHVPCPWFLRAWIQLELHILTKRLAKWSAVAASGDDLANEGSDAHEDVSFDIPIIAMDGSSSFLPPSPQTSQHELLLWLLVFHGHTPFVEQLSQHPLALLLTQPSSQPQLPVNTPFVVRGIPVGVVGARSGCHRNCRTSRPSVLFVSYRCSAA